MSKATIPPRPRSAHAAELNRELPEVDRPGSREEAPKEAPKSANRADVFNAAIQATRVPMVITDPSRSDNPIVFANDAFLAMTGYTREEISGSNCRFLQGPETDPATVAEIRLALAERRTIATEILNYRKDGHSFWCALSISPIFNDRGDVVYYSASQLDVSRRRAAEDALRQTRKMEAMGRLTGGVAHDFNNLLQVMVGYFELIGNGLRKPEIDREKLLRGIDNARAAADRATDLTRHLLAFARQHRHEDHVLNMNDLILMTRDLADRILGDDVAFTTTLAEDLWNCRIDPTQAETALLNIMINARDAMRGRPDKRVEIETANVNIDREDLGRYPTMAPGHYVSISIADTGTGVPSHIAERIMDPFFTTKHDGNNSGLSFSMAHGFAKRSGGSALIHAEPDVGTSVRVYFPATDDVATQQTASGSRALDRSGTETILIVEQRADVAAFARSILEYHGYTVLQASSAGAAIEVIDSDADIHMLFSELVLPNGLDGVALARLARQRRQSLKVLLTTGYPEASAERSDLGGSEFDMLDKPYGRMDLTRAIRVVLDGLTA